LNELDRVFVRTELPKALYSTGIVNDSKYDINGSVGQGNWATIPWIAIFDRSITTSATKGVYIVYLLAKDTNTLYLTFNQGCTEISATHSKQETIEIMRANAKSIVDKIDSRNFQPDEGINLGDGLTRLGEFYQKGTIFYKAYQKGSIPSEQVLQDDLRRMIDIYQEYARECGSHLYGKFDSWEIVDENTAIKHCDKSFFDHNGSGVPRDICWFFRAEDIPKGNVLQVALNTTYCMYL